MRFLRPEIPTVAPHSKETRRTSSSNLNLGRGGLQAQSQTAVQTAAQAGAQTQLASAASQHETKMQNSRVSVRPLTLNHLRNSMELRQQAISSLSLAKITIDDTSKFSHLLEEQRTPRQGIVVPYDQALKASSHIQEEYCHQAHAQISPLASTQPQPRPIHNHNCKLFGQEEGKTLPSEQTLPPP